MTTSTSLPETREQRALKLFSELGHEICLYIDGTFWVPSSTNRDVGYHVDIEGSTLSQPCECEDYNKTHAICKHQLAATIKQAKVNAEGAKRCKEAQERSTKREKTRFTPSQILSNLAQMGA